MTGRQHPSRPGARLAAARRLAAGAALALGMTGCLGPPSLAAPSTFEQALLAQPPIPQPDQPFVLIFHQSDSDRDHRYGFATDGAMSRDAWRRVYQHVGHLVPYAVYRPDWPELWRTADKDLALEAAQGLGRPTGASIFALPRTPEEAASLLRAYADPVGLGVTHVFDDVEDDLGVPGGSGRWRARALGVDQARLESDLSPWLDTGVGQPLASFEIVFGVTAGDHVFGGEVQILELQAEPGAAWSIAFVNQGGQEGANRFVVRSETGEELASPPMDGWLGRQWHEVALSLDGADGDARVRVTLAVEGLDAVTATMTRPAPGPRRLRIGSGSGKAFSIDDLVLTGRVDGRPRTLARYGFEDPGPDQPALRRVADDSGHGHTLQAASGFDLLPTTGADPELYAKLERYLVVDLLAARAAAGRPPPRVLTNWRLSEQPHRLAAYQAAGFTHGNTVYYLYPPPAGMDAFTYIFEHARSSLKTQWAWADGARWSTAWIGNVHPDRAALAPADFASLVTLAVLDGNRDLIVFTSMSGGHLGRPGLTRAAAAAVNAEALYAMATAASWFQSTSGTLAVSRYLADAPLLDQRGGIIFRARANDATGELWLAALAPAGPTAARVRLPAAHGTLTNLATGQTTPVAGGLATIALSRAAEPYHFKPAP